MASKALWEGAKWEGAKWEGAKWHRGEMAQGRNGKGAKWEWGHMAKGKMGRGRNDKGRNGTKFGAKWERAKREVAKWEVTNFIGNKYNIFMQFIFQSTLQFSNLHVEYVRLEQSQILKYKRQWQN
jgi:hypothetical protein